MSHNGWTNYITWRVNLEFIDGMSAHEFYADNERDLAIELREFVEEYFDENTNSTYAYSYALLALAEVDWREIASHLLSEEG